MRFSSATPTARRSRAWRVPDAQGRARFPGCVYCHEVTAGGDAAPQITKPVIMDRWFVHAGFNHAKHTQISKREMP